MPDARDSQRFFNPDARLGEATTQPLQNGFDVLSPLVAKAQSWTQQMAMFNASIQREWLNFVDKRLKEDTAFGQSLATCKAPDDVMRATTSFYRTAFEDYQKEFSTLAQLGVSITTDAIKDANTNGSQPSAAGGAPTSHVAATRRDPNSPAASH
jgi:Phasin protein